MSHAPIEDRAVAILGRRANGTLALDELLAELADADCVTALGDVIAERGQLRADLVRRALDMESDEPSSVICRAAGFNMNGYSAVLRMRRRHNRGTGSPPALALTFFSGLSRVAAERALARVLADLVRTPVNL
jgi:hypothetical protein